MIETNTSTDDLEKITISLTKLWEHLHRTATTHVDKLIESTHNVLLHRDRFPDCEIPEPIVFATNAAFMDLGHRLEAYHGISDGLLKAAAETLLTDENLNKQFLGNYDGQDE